MHAQLCQAVPQTAWSMTQWLLALSTSHTRPRAQVMLLNQGLRGAWQAEGGQQLPGSCAAGGGARYERLVMEAVQCFVEVGRRQGAPAAHRVRRPLCPHPMHGHPTVEGMRTQAVVLCWVCIAIAPGHLERVPVGTPACLSLCSHVPCAWSLFVCLHTILLAHAGARHPQHADLNMVSLDTASMHAWQAAVHKVCLSFDQLQAVLGIR